MSISGPDFVVLGEGSVSMAISQILDKPLISDGSLVSERLNGDFPPSLPLLNCDLVFQVISPNHADSTALWRHRMFWNIYGKLGGADPRSRGLRWCVLSCHSDRTKEIFQQAFRAETCLKNYAWTALDDGLMSILGGSQNAETVYFHDWSEQQRRNREESSRAQMKALLSSGKPDSEIHSEALALAGQVSELAWENFCPPPRSHALANAIRQWLREPVTENVIPWIATGRELLDKTNL